MKWFEHSENQVDPYQLAAPYDNIWVGPDPLDGMTPETAKSYNAVINVSDSPCAVFEPSYPGQAMHWYPVNEIGRWNLSYLFWLKRVLDYHHEQGHKIYLHCHAGAYRSPSAAVLWLQSRGHSPEEALKLGAFCGDDSGLYRLWKSYRNVHPLYQKIYQLMREHPTWSFASVILRDQIRSQDKWNPEFSTGYCRNSYLKHHYFWWYYQPKWWINNKITYLKYWLDGSGWFSEGIGTYIYTRKDFWSRGRNAEPKSFNDVSFWVRNAKNPPEWAKKLVGSSD